jgi:hypothetical protein
MIPPQASETQAICIDRNITMANQIAGPMVNPSQAIES